MLAKITAYAVGYVTSALALWGGSFLLAKVGIMSGAIGIKAAFVLALGSMLVTWLVSWIMSMVFGAVSSAAPVATAPAAP